MGPLPGPPALLCLLSAGCLLGWESSPSGGAYASACRLSWRTGAAGALTVPSLRQRVRESFFPLCLVLSPSGVHYLSRVCSSVGSPVGVAHSFHPSLLLGGGLVRFGGGLC